MLGLLTIISDVTRSNEQQQVTGMHNAQTAEILIIIVHSQHLLTVYPVNILMIVLCVFS